MDEIHEVTGMKLAELRDVKADRKHWRRMAKTVARTRRVDSTRLRLLLRTWYGFVIIDLRKRSFALPACSSYDGSPDGRYPPRRKLNISYSI